MKTKRETRKKTPEIICAVLLSATLAVCHAADINVVIPWQGGAAFTTNINVYGTTLGYSKTLRVTPQPCYHFKSLPTETHGRVTVVAGTVNHCEANYTMTLTSTNLQGWITVSGEIEPSNECGSCGTGGGGNPQDQNFDVTVTQRVAWAYFTLPANGTNLTCCGGTTNAIETKVVLGDAGIPSAGTIAFSASPSTLGSFTSNNITLSPSGTAGTSFIASTNGGSGTITASASSLKDEQSKDVPNVSTNLTAQVVELTLLSVDAQDPNQAKANYEMNPSNLSGQGYFAVRGTNSTAAVSGDFYFSFDQGYLSDEHGEPMNLVVSVGEASCTNATVISVTYTNNTATELLLAYFTAEGVGLKVYNHTLTEGVKRLGYEVPASGKTRLLLGCVTGLAIGDDPVTGGEEHKYSFEGSFFTNMSSCTSMDGGICYSRSAGIWVAASSNIAGIARTTSLIWHNEDGSATAGILVNNEVNTSVP